MSLSPSQPSTTVKVNLPPQSLWLHPITIYSIVWLGVLFLYSLHLSYLLSFSLTVVSKTVLYVWLPFVVMGLVLALCSLSTTKLARISPATGRSFDIDINSLERRLKIAFRVWVALSIVEVIHARGVAIIWALLHTGKTYVDFGIPTLHGFVDALLLSIGLGHFVIALTTGSRRNYGYAIFVIIWTLIIINRNMMLVAFLEYTFVFLTLRQVRPKTLIRIAAGALSFVLLFGVVGDIRQPIEGGIRQLAQPTDHFPEYLPSGFLWIYVYATTPLQNLTFNIARATPINNILFPNTLGQILPTVVRGAVFGPSGEAMASGALEVSAFNVSTAFIGPFEDFGVLGIIALSTFLGFWCEYSWLRSRLGLSSLLNYSVLMQCLVLTTFFNHFFDLPVITQVLWIPLLCSKKVIKR